MKEPRFYLEQFRNRLLNRLPKLQDGLAVTSNEEFLKPVSPNDIVAVICINNRCFKASYLYGVSKLLNIVNGNGVVAESFDCDLSITFYHKVSGAVTYSINHDLREKLYNMSFFIQKSLGVPVSEIPGCDVNEVLQMIFNYTDDKIFDVVPEPEFRSFKMLQMFLDDELHK